MAYPSSCHTIALGQSGMKKLLARQAPVDTSNDEGAGDNSRSFQWPQRTRLLAAIPRFAPPAIRLELEPGMLALASLPSQQHQYPGCAASVKTNGKPNDSNQRYGNASL